MTDRSRRTYDHRVKEQIVLSGNPDLLLELEIPRSTALSWIRRGVGEVVSLDTGREVEAALRTRVFELEHRTAVLIAGELYAVFDREFWRTKLHNASSRMLGAAAALGKCSRWARRTRAQRRGSTSSSRRRSATARIRSPSG